MTNNLTTFNFNNKTVRTQVIDGQPYFCLADCCKALDIHNSKTSVKLSEAGVGKTYISHPSGRKLATFINEPNLYRLIFRSNKPQAQAFADWVYSDVLPSIRKTGMYISPVQEEFNLQPYTLTQDKQALKVIGGMIKRCCSSAIKETLTTDDVSIKSMTAILDYLVTKRSEQQARDLFYAWKLQIQNELKQIVS